jgi:UDP-N-acetylmuramate: L-alanyl-gamma-D-glutamyl-meso-diaminopimelate ligase
MLRKEVNTTCPATSGIHFVGMCGTAMASVAAMCRERGYAVTGSDENVYPPMSTFLEARGIRIMTGYRESNLDHKPDLVVVGNAVTRGNPEVERLLDERWNYCSLPELVREFFIRGNHSIVVAGTHGKTTTTSLLAWVLESAGLSPGFLIGGIPVNFGCGGRVCGLVVPLHEPDAHDGTHPQPLPRGESPRSSPPRRGSGGSAVVTTQGHGPSDQSPITSHQPFFVIEGDEYDTAFFDKRSKFVHYLPGTVILNNIEFDHADIFPDLAAVKRAFRQLVAVIPRRGLLIANGGDANVHEVVTGAQCRVRFFTKADFDGFIIPLAGEHNQRNAAAVAVCAAESGLSREQIQQGFSTFRGVKRRMEVRGEAAGVTVIDDFAHHPTAIAETIRAIRAKYPHRRLWALFEPRSNTTRRNVFQRELAESLALADGVFIAQVHRLNALAESERLKPEQIIETLRRAGKVAEYSPDGDQIVTRLVPQLREHDVVAVFSNGKFDDIYEKLLARLGQTA